jgi:hypothetical protein
MQQEKVLDYCNDCKRQHQVLLEYPVRRNYLSSSGIVRNSTPCSVPSWLKFQLGVSLVCATGPTYFSFLNRYVTIINISRATNTAPDTLKFVFETGKVGGVNDQMKQLIEYNWK